MSEAINLCKLKKMTYWWAGLLLFNVFIGLPSVENFFNPETSQVWSEQDNCVEREVSFTNQKSNKRSFLFAFLGAPVNNGSSDKTYKKISSVLANTGKGLQSAEAFSSALYLRIYRSIDYSKPSSRGPPAKS